VACPEQLANLKQSTLLLFTKLKQSTDRKRFVEQKIVLS
jgi:hypothetical protein